MSDNAKCRAMVEELLRARQALENAEAVVLVKRQQYIDAESRFFPDNRPYVNNQWAHENLVFGSTLIMAVEDWYDVKPGDRFRFYKVQVIEDERV